MSDVAARVSALEEAESNEPTTIWTGTNPEVSFSVPLSTYSSFIVYTTRGTANGVPATDGFYMNFSGFNIGVSKTSNGLGFQIFTRTNNNNITRIDAYPA